MHVAQDKHDKERRDLLEYFLVNSDGGTVRGYLGELRCEEVRWCARAIILQTRYLLLASSPA